MAGLGLRHSRWRRRKDELLGLVASLEEHDAGSRL
jgi:hypothetical protein